MSELKEMGKPLYGVLVICKNYEKYDCCHNGTKMARGCLKDIIEKGNKDRLIFATKDPKVGKNWFSLYKLNFAHEILQFALFKW